MDNAGAFSVHRVQQLFDTIRADLEDLCHIDLMVQYKKSFYEESGGDILDDLNPFSAEVTLGRRYPFDMNVGAYHGQGALAKVDGEARAQARSWAAEMVDPVRQQVGFVVDARPIHAEHAVADLERVSRDLKTVLPPQLTEARAELSGWRGEARDSFDGFLGDALIAVGNLNWAVEAMRSSLAQTAAVMHMGQLALTGALETIARGLDEQLRKRQDDEEGKQEMIQLVLLAATGTGVLGSIPWPAGPALAATSALLGFVKDQLPEPDAHLEKVPLQTAGSYATSLHDAINRTVDGTRSRWDTAHATGASRLRSEALSLMPNRAGERFEPKVPGAAEAPPAPGAFTPSQ